VSWCGVHKSSGLSGVGWCEMVWGLVWAHAEG
jgi:hypothetical protein